MCADGACRAELDACFNQSAKCGDIADCVREQDCQVSTPGGANHCYCGSNDPLSCVLLGGGGVCEAEIETAVGTRVLE